MNHEHAPHNGITLWGRHYIGGQFLPFYVPRDRMPQIDEEHYPRLVRDALQGPGIAFATINPHNLFAHQKIDHHRAENMDLRLRIKPLIVSADDYVVDGNHRWWANVYGGASWINVLRLNTDFEAAIAWAGSLPYAYHIQPGTRERN